MKDRVSRQRFRDQHPGSPSWPWASVWLEKGALFSTPPITYNLVSSVGLKTDTRFSVLEAKCSSRAPFGVYNEAWLRLRGAVISTTYVFEGRSGMVRFISAGQLDVNAKMRDVVDGELLYSL